jgi:hypothetical protein
VSKGETPIMVQFIEAINIGGQVVNSCDVKVHKCTLEKTATGIWIKRPPHRNRWVPDGQIRWIEFD